VVHAYNPNTQESEARGTSIQGHPDYIAKPYLKKQQNKQTNKNLKTIT
jgi:hypothetical protein